MSRLTAVRPHPRPGLECVGAFTTDEDGNEAFARITDGSYTESLTSPGHTIHGHGLPD